MVGNFIFLKLYWMLSGSLIKNIVIDLYIKSI